MLSDTISQIRYWHRQRCFAMEQRKRMDLALGSFIRLMLGWSKDKPEDERKALAKRAADLIAAADDPEWGDIINASILARKPFTEIEKHASKEMDKLAESLPAWESFGAGVRGFGSGSLAVIVGEAGDLSNYADKGKLWKRMGLAVFDGRKQGHVAKGLSREDRSAAFIEHGYSPLRRSRIWNIGDALIKGNRDGVYRQIYLARKQYEIERNPEMTKMYAHRRAQRYMEKHLLKHLWQAWRKAKTGVSGKIMSRLPSSVYSDAA